MESILRQTGLRQTGTQRLHPTETNFLDGRRETEYLYVDVNVKLWHTSLIIKKRLMETHPKDHNKTYSIRQLSKEFDVTARALRFYEDKGLISPERKGQTRLYSPRDRARLQLILRGKRLGFSLIEIHEILDLYTPKDHGAAQMRATLAKYRGQIETLKRQREDIEAAITDMSDGCVWLESQIHDFETENLFTNKD